MPRRRKKDLMTVDIEKIIAMRRESFYSKSRLSIAMNYNRPHICQIERGERPFTPASLEAFKTVLGLEGVPITDHEVEEYKKNELENLKDVLISDELCKADELIPKIANIVNLSRDEGLQLLFKLYSAVYYYMSENETAFNQTIAELKECEANFSDVERYWWHKVLGHGAIMAGQYKTAYGEFLKCVKLKKQIKIKDKTLSVTIAYCLTYMGHSLKAIEILKREINKRLKRFHISHSLPIKAQLAVNYINTGQAPKALKLINKIMRESGDKVREYKLEGLFHQVLAEAYQKLGDFHNAIENINIALERVEQNRKVYVGYLYEKASILINFGKNSSCAKYIDEGLAFYPDDEALNGLLLNMIKHSLQMHEKDSLIYLHKVVIPNLKKRGIYLEAIKLYTRMGDFCSKNKLHKDGLIFYRHAYMISQKLWKGDFEI